MKENPYKSPASMEPAKTANQTRDPYPWLVEVIAVIAAILFALRVPALSSIWEH